MTPSQHPPPSPNAAPDFAGVAVLTSSDASCDALAGRHDARRFPKRPVAPGMLVVMFWSFTAMMLAARIPTATTYLYVGGALMIALWCWWSAPVWYAPFVWTVWFATPLVRRLVDYQSDWHPVNPVMLAPPLATSVAALCLFDRRFSWAATAVRPFILVLGGVLYGLGVGVGKNGILSPLFDVLDWLVPPVFACHLLMNRADPRHVHQMIGTTFSIGVGVMGTYGIAQFVDPAPWDRFWMQHAPINSIGSPEPYLVRVFGTMNSPGPFALVLTAGLLFLVEERGRRRWLAAALAAAALLLSGVRSAWGGYMLASIFAAATARRGSRAIVFGLAIVIISAAFLLLTVEPIGQFLGRRLATVAELEDDDSLTARLSFYDQLALTSFSQPVGLGLGSTGRATKLDQTGDTASQFFNFDSGLMQVPLVLGWPGSLLYATGICWAIVRAVRRARDVNSRASIPAAIAVGLIAQMVFSNVLLGVVGMVFWTAVGLALAPPDWNNVSRRAVSEP